MSKVGRKEKKEEPKDCEEKRNENETFSRGGEKRLIKLKEINRPEEKRKRKRREEE